ncbi:MAG: metallophosphoesterase [Bacteroidales bacterium]
MRKEFILLVSLFLLLCESCDLIDYHPYDAKDSGVKDVNATAIKNIQNLCEWKEVVRFAWMGDTQRWYDETDDFVQSVNMRSDIDFVMHGGDISDFGMTQEFTWVHRIMKKLNVPYVALLGNHDVLGNGISVYHSMYGAENFSFIAGDTKFVCLNTNALEFDYSHPVPDFSFIKKEIEDANPAVKRTVVAMHTPPFGEQFDNNVADVFQMYIRKLPGLTFCMHAHTHKLKVQDLFGDGIIYYGCASMKERSYIVFTLTPLGYEYEVVYF